MSALRYDGTNRQELEDALGEHMGVPISLIELLDDGCWLLLEPDARWRVVAEQNYRQPTCFHCKHYWLVGGRGRCSFYEEDVDSEIAAAANCDEYDEEA